MEKYVLALDLKDDPALIDEYEQWHRRENGWPQVTKSIQDAGITNMEIYRTGNRLFMILEVREGFSFEEKSRLDQLNTKVQEWENLMLQFQEPLPWAAEGEKWVLMKKIFQLPS